MTCLVNASIVRPVYILVVLLHGTQFLLGKVLFAQLRPMTVLSFGLPRLQGHGIHVSSLLCEVISCVTAQRQSYRIFVQVFQRGQDRRGLGDEAVPLVLTHLRTVNRSALVVVVRGGHHGGFPCLKLVHHRDLVFCDFN